MEKAWSYFETDEDIFKVILKGLTNEEKALLKKQFGKDYDGINVRTSIKKNEKNDFNALCERILIDVAFAKKLKAYGKVTDNYMANSNYNVLKKLAYTYDIDTESLNTMINSLASNERQAFIYYFGIDRKKMTIFNISNLLSTDEFNTFVCLKSAISSIKRKCENSLTINKSKINLKNKDDIPASFTSQLIKKGYTLKEISFAAKQLSSETYLVLKKYYGRDLNQIRSFIIKINDDDKKLILDALYGNNSIEKKIVNLKTKKEEKSEKEETLPSFFEGNLQVYYQKLGYPKSALIEAFRNLNSDDKKTLFLGFDHSFNSIDISKYTKDVRDNIYRLAFSTDAGLQYYLIKNSKSKNVVKNKINLYSKYHDKGFSHEMVDIAINLLSEDKQKKIRSCFNLKGNQIKVLSEENGIYNILDSSLPIRLKTVAYVAEKTQNLGEYLVCYNLTKEDIKKYIETLSENDQNIFYNYYDENLRKNDDAVLDINIYQLLTELIKNRNNIKKTKLCLKGINLFDKYEKKHCSRSLIEAALNDLSPKSLSIIKEAFDENGNQIKTIESCKGLSQIINLVLVKKIQAVQEYSKKMENLYSYFIQLGFNELEIKTALLSLNESEKRILDTYYNDLYIKYDDAEFNKDVYVLLKNIEDKIFNLNLYEKYRRLGYTKGEVDKAISMMDTYKKNSLKNYLYGDLNFIKSIRNNYYMLNIINVVIPKFLKKIKTEGYFPNIYEKLADLGYEHSIAEIMLNILPPSYLVALKPYFDNKGNQIREYKNVNSVTRIFKNVLPRIGENIKKFNNKTEYLYDYFKDKNYCKVRVDKIISELNDNERQVLYTYYEKDLSRREDQKLDMVLFDFINNLEEKLSYHNLYDMYKDMGYTKEEVDLVLNTKLHNGANSKLRTYFDEELNLKKEYLKGNYAYRVVNELIPGKLHELKKEKNDYETINKFLFDSYLKEIKDTNVFNEKTISSLNISDKKKYYLNVEFVFNKLSTFKSEDIAKLLKMDHSEYISNVYYAILSARNILNATLDDSLENIKKVLD